MYKVSGAACSHWCTSLHLNNRSTPSKVIITQASLVCPVFSLFLTGQMYIVACQRGGVSNKPALGSGQRQDTESGILWSVHRWTRPRGSLQPAELNQDSAGFERAIRRALTELKKRNPPRPDGQVRKRWPYTHTSYRCDDVFRVYGNLTYKPWKGYVPELWFPPDGAWCKPSLLTIWLYCGNFLKWTLPLTSTTNQILAHFSVLCRTFWVTDTGHFPCWRPAIIVFLVGHFPCTEPCLSKCPAMSEASAEVCYIFGLSVLKLNVHHTMHVYNTCIGPFCHSGTHIH